MKKILVLGVEQSNFLSFLYCTLKKYENSFFISAPNIKDLKGVKNESWMYNNENINRNKSALSFLKAIVFCLFDKHLYQTFFFILFVERKLLKSFHFIIKQTESKAFFIQNDNFKDYDTFHFHYMQYSYLRELFLVPKNKKIVCTFWGSDLLRTTDILNYYFVKKSLDRSTYITCQSLELKEIILSKYGRSLEDKIKIAIFPTDEAIYDGIDLNQDSKDLIHDFKLKYNYSTNKLNVLIGHNGRVFINHVKIINALKEIKNKQKIHLIVNLNYAIKGLEKDRYKKEILKALDESEYTYVLLEEYFSKEELAISRLASDIFIHMPDSDALSGTMLELLYASNVVITASWLPYKTFRKAKLEYFEVDDFNQLTNEFDFVVDNYAFCKKQAINNKKAIKDYFFSDKIIKNWATVLN